VAGDDYELVPANAVDEARLTAFARAVWPDVAPEVRIASSWWRRTGPEHAIAAVYRPSGAMAGILAGWPCAWTIGGQRVPAIAYSDWFVAPDHGGHGLGKRLAAHFDAPGRFVYAFSLSDAAVANFKRMGWHGPGASFLMAQPLPQLAGLLARPVPGLSFEAHEIGGDEALNGLGRDLDIIEAAHGRAIPARARRAAADWAWRLSVCGPRRYHFTVARHAASGAAAGYVVVRRMIPGVRSLMDRLRAAIVTDLVAADDDPAVLRALAQRAAVAAAALGSHLLIMGTSNTAHRRALGRFLSPATPLVGGALARRSPQFMWRPEGLAASLHAADLSITFADGATDLDL
jgi:hypothetical protein